MTTAGPLLFLTGENGEDTGTWSPAHFASLGQRMPGGIRSLAGWFQAVADVEPQVVLCLCARAQERFRGVCLNGNQPWQLLYAEQGKVKRTTDAIFPHYRPRLPDGTKPDIVTERQKPRSVGRTAIWFLRLPEENQEEALQDYEDGDDLQQQVCHAISDAMVPGKLKDYVALMQVLP